MTEQDQTSQSETQAEAPQEGPQASTSGPAAEVAADPAAAPEAPADAVNPIVAPVEEIAPPDQEPPAPEADENAGLDAPEEAEERPAGFNENSYRGIPAGPAPHPRTV